MRFLLLALMVIPAAMAVECMFGTNGVFARQSCMFPSEYCATITQNDVITKNCGGAVCSNTGDSHVSGATCCKGALCNAAASGSSLLMMALIGLVTAWSWY